MTDDPVIQRVRMARHVISEKCDHDPDKLVTYYFRRQQAHSDRLRRRVAKTASASAEQQ